MPAYNRLTPGLIRTHTAINRNGMAGMIAQVTGEFLHWLLSSIDSQEAKDRLQ